MPDVYVYDDLPKPLRVQIVHIWWACSVRITQGRNELRGRSAELDLKTGTSRMQGGEGGVRGLFVPKATPAPEDKTTPGKTKN